MTLHISSVFTYDEDAGNYIQAVEAADGQALEGATRKAINNFVLGCKADGIWNAIKASCILAGARTLSGALVPLTGTAPTNFNFVAGDYGRKAGLKGNASTKYIDTNRAGNADPQDNYHSSVFLSESTGATQFYMGLTPEIALVSSSITMKIPNSSRVTVGSPALGFIGGARNSGAQFASRLSRTSTTFSTPSTASSTANIFLFSGGPGLINSDARLAFYSIGESLDLTKLDARVTDLITAFGAAIP